MGAAGDCDSGRTRLSCPTLRVGLASQEETAGHWGPLEAMARGARSIALDVKPSPPGSSSRPRGARGSEAHAKRPLGKPTATFRMRNGTCFPQQMWQSSSRWALNG